MEEWKQSQEETDALSYLDWSDERLGQFVRYVAGIMRKVTKDNIGDGMNAVHASAAMAVLISDQVNMNAAKMKYTAQGYSISGKAIGDVTVTINIKYVDGYNPEPRTEDVCLGK